MAHDTCHFRDCLIPIDHSHGTDSVYGPRPVVKVSLHTADPGPSGTEHEAPMYPRQKTSWTAASAGSNVLGVVTFSARPEMPDFDEDTTSVRGPGWGTRTCPHCDHTTFGGYESVTKEEMWEHLDERCPVLHPKAPSIGGFDAALYAAYRAGVESEFEGYDTDGNAEGFRRWRAQWHGEWVTE